MVDLDGNIIYVNPMFEPVTGYSLEEVIGRNPRTLSGGKKSKPEYRELWNTILAGMFISDAADVIVRVNQAAHQESGV